MRRTIVLVSTAAALALVAACGGGGGGELAGQSGALPVVTEATTTTTETVVPEEPAVDEPVEVPDPADLGLTWSQAPVVDEATGRVNVHAFNRMLVEATDFTALVPMEEARAAADPAAALAEATAEAPARAVALFLGLDPDDDQTQMLLTEEPEGTRVVVVQLHEDDSVRATRWELVVQVQPRAAVDGLEEEATEEEPAGEDGATATTEAPETTTTVAPTPDLVPVISTAQRTVQCQPGRGHQDFGTGQCA